VLAIGSDPRVLAQRTEPVSGFSDTRVVVPTVVPLVESSGVAGRDVWKRRTGPLAVGRVRFAYNFFVRSTVHPGSVVLGAETRPDTSLVSVRDVKRVPASREHVDILHGWKAADSVNQHAVQRNVQQHQREPALRWGDMFYPRHPS